MYSKLYIFKYINKFNNMIGSHNSYTYLKAVNKPIFNKFTKYWRCQYKSIQEQYDAGVRFFDIRVATELVKVGSKYKVMWRSCHGACNLDNIFTTLSVACKQFKDLGPDVKIRILLEKGDDNDIAFFKNESEKILKRYSSIITQIVIKNKWQVIYEDWQGITMTDYCYIPWNSARSFWYNVKHFSNSTIQKWANEHNPTLTKEMIDDPKHIYFMDMV